MAEGKMIVKEDEDEQDNYVGRTVKKFFLGFGFFHGKVISFNRARKFFRVKYDDGDREELDLKELRAVLVDDNPQPPPLLVPSAEGPRSNRRGRKRKRDSAEKDGPKRAGVSAGVGERSHDNNPPVRNNSACREMADVFSPLKLAEVRVLDAQTQEIYRHLTGSVNEEGKAGIHHGDQLLLEPLVPVALANAFEKSVEQAGFEFEHHRGEDDEARRIGSCHNLSVPDDTASPCRLKRTRVSPIAESCLQQMLTVKDEENGAKSEEVGTVKMEETAITMADVGLPPAAAEADSPPLWDVGNNNSDQGKKDGGSSGGGSNPPEKVQFSAFVLSLPPSSRNLGALDDCVAELFQVYSLLRSFSNMIFLSPFSLDELAYSLVSNDACSLIDCVHLSLLQSLRRQLERLSKNGSKSATFTLRLSDWSLLDFITWPSFLMGYMLTQGFNFDRGDLLVKPGLTKSGEYYKLPVRTKLSILSFLCDKVLDTDEARAELARRVILEHDPEPVESKAFAQKKPVKESAPDMVDDNERTGTGKDEGSGHGGVGHAQHSSIQSVANTVRVGRHLDEDGNLDECVLCAMDGNLICCDGCPAAYHSRCVGVTKSGLPPGDWFCPECRADKEDPRGGRISKRVRGGELLAIGPDGQLFYNTCGYLLISEAGPGGEFIHRHYSPGDLYSVIRLLEEAGPEYAHLRDAALQLCEVETRVAIETNLKASVLEAAPSLVSCSKNGREQSSQVETGVQTETTLKASVLEAAPSLASCSQNGGQQPCEVDMRAQTETTLKASSVLEASPSLVSCSQNGLEHPEGQYTGSIMLGTDGPVELEKPVPVSASLTGEKTKKSDILVSCFSSATTNGELLSLRPKQELGEMQDLPAIDSNQMNGLAELESSFPFPESFVSEDSEMKKFDFPASAIGLPPKEEHQGDPNLHVSGSINHVNGAYLTSDALNSFIGDDDEKPRAGGDDTSKPGFDEMPFDFTDEALTAELDIIWRQDSLGDEEQLLMQALESPGPEALTGEDGRDKVVPDVDSSRAGVSAVGRGKNGTLLDRSGSVGEGKISGLGLAQQGANGGIETAAVNTPGIPSSKQQVTEQRDAGASLEKRGDAVHVESGGSEREVEYLSTITQMNACSYTNKYANSDLVASSAFNLAVMAGGVDDLVDDKIGPAKKFKPSSVADQLKAFTQASSHFYWPSVKKRAKDVPKEKCGWCINCRASGRRGCLLTQVAGQMAGGAALVVGGIRPIKAGSGHFPTVAAYLLYIEDNLHNLLLGPWEYSGHRKQWRKQVEQATSLKDIKLALLEMESSMRSVLLSSDWQKAEEDAPESISSSTIITITAGAPSGKKAAPTKKRGRPSVVAKTPAVSSYDGACFGIKWWRGGKLSRKVYNWESLPRATLRRAGRQGGSKEIPELVYSKSLDLPRRSRQFAWRTRLEKISSLSQVAVEVRYLDTFIKWNDIISPQEASTTHNVKGPVETDPAFHNLEIRTMKEEGGEVRYLLSAPTDTDEKTDAKETQQEAASKGVGSGPEKPNGKKNQTTPNEDPASDELVTESQVPLFLLKAFVEKKRAEYQSEMPRALKKSNLKGSNQQKKLTFWKMLCSPRLTGLFQSKKQSNWACGDCRLTGSESQRVRCQRCKVDFHKNCIQDEDAVKGQAKVSVCKNCVQLRLGHRKRKPSYKMLVMQSEQSDGNEVAADVDGASAGNVKFKLKRSSRAESTSPQDHEMFDKKKKKKRLLSMPTPLQLHGESPWMEEKQDAKKKKLNKGFTNVVPLQYEGEPNRVGKKKKKKKTLLVEEEVDPAQPPKKKRGRKKKIVCLGPSEAEDKQQEKPASLDRRISIRIRNSISPNTTTSLPTTDFHSPRISKKRSKLENESTEQEKSTSKRRRKGKRKDSPAEAQGDGVGEDVEIKLPVKRKRLKIIFGGLEIAKDLDIGVDEVRPRKSTNGLDFGSRATRSVAEIERFKRERVVLEDQLVLDDTRLRTCGICSERYAAGHSYINCEYCDSWYHGIAVGLRLGDAAHLIGFKCHRCRKCRAPPCPMQQNSAGVKTRRRGTIDHGEVIDAENVNRTGQFESLSLQSSWFDSPEKDFSGFDDCKALPDFVSATNQAEEALAADGSIFGHDVLSHDFDMSDLVLVGDTQVELNPLSLEDQQNAWASNDSSQLDLPPFSVSQGDLSSQAAQSLSFTELLAADDIFEGVEGGGLVLGTEWSGAMYGSDSVPSLKPSTAADITMSARVDDYSSQVNANGNFSDSDPLAPPLKSAAGDITMHAGMDAYSALASANGTHQTDLPLD